jgi:hypothetical protein
VNDAKLQTSVATCVTQATPAYFTISGTVRRSNGTTPVTSAVVQIKLGTVVARTVYTNTLGAFTTGATMKPGLYTIVVTKTGHVIAPLALPQIGPSQTAVTINATTP